MDEISIQNSSLPMTNSQMQTQTQPPVTNSHPETTLFDDLGKIKQCIDKGIVTPLQGQNLINHVVNKAYNMVTQREVITPDKSPLDDFVTKNPTFFDSEGRNAVLEYLQNNKVSHDEISQIATLIELVENTAIENYLRKKDYEKNLKNKNEEAKQRLTSNAQNSALKSALVGSFTRDQIGKMSGAEFTQNEKAIMDQLRKGLIK